MELPSIEDALMDVVQICGGHVATSALMLTLCSDLTKSGTVLGVSVTVTVTGEFFRLEQSKDITIDCLGDATGLAMCS